MWSRLWFLMGLPLVIGLALIFAEGEPALAILRDGWVVFTLFAVAYTAAWGLAAEFERFPTTHSGEAMLFGAAVALVPVGAIVAVGPFYAPPYFIELAGIASALWLGTGVWGFKQQARSRFAVLPGGAAYDLLRSVAGTHEVQTSGHEIPESADGVVADLHRLPHNGFHQLLASNSLRGLPIYHAAYLYEMLTGCVLLEKTCDVSIEGRPTSWVYGRVKRAADVILVVMSMPLTLPIMLLAALAIKLESPGPVLFVQERVGRYGEPFQMLKFRSMCTDAEDEGAQFADEADTRVTRVGQFLRKYRIDELPQFWNVLRGDMSLIGPRPEQITFVGRFREEIPFYSQRHIVRPGITGWAQVRNGYAASTSETRQKLAYDLYYVKHRSLVLDLLIICLTIKTMLTGFGSR